jgi:hypothetical protein
MAGVVLWSGRGMASGALGPSPSLGPYVMMAALLVIMVSSSLYTLSRYLRPDLRRPIRENRRVYRSRLILHNSLLGLLALPPLLLFQATADPINLFYYSLMIIGLTALSWPSARAYQRWLLSGSVKK